MEDSEIARFILQTKKGTLVLDKVRFYDFQNGDALSGYVNVPYIRDIPYLQFRQIGEERPETLTIMRRKATSVKHFATNIQPQQVVDYAFSGKPVEHLFFPNYPSYFKAPKRKRREIVYIDNSAGTVYNYRQNFEFLDKLKKMSGMEVIFISTRYPELSRKMVEKEGYDIKVMQLDTRFTLPSRKLEPTELPIYDYGSKYGLLLDTVGLNQASTCLARKLLLYLMLEMVPLIPSHFDHSIQFMVDEQVRFKAYATVNELRNLRMASNHDGHRFSIEYNMPRLLEHLQSLNSKPADYTPPPMAPSKEKAIARQQAIPARSVEKPQRPLYKKKKGYPRRG